MTGTRQKLFEKQAQVIRAVGHPIRIAILESLRDGEQCVCDIAEYVGAERSNVSRHLSVMVAAGILQSRKDGLKVIYQLKAPCVFDFFRCVSRVLKKQVKEEETLVNEL